jgi:hypothetical protein
MLWLIVSVSGQRLVERVAPHDGSKRGLGDLTDRGGGVLDRHHRANRISDPVIGHGRHVDADVVARDDPLRLDRQRDDAKRNAMHPVHARHDRNEPRPPCATAYAPEPEHHRELVLLDDPNRKRQTGEHYHQHDNDDVDGDHVGSFGAMDLLSATVSLWPSGSGRLADTRSMVAAALAVVVALKATLSATAMAVAGSHEVHPRAPVGVPTKAAPRLTTTRADCTNLGPCSFEDSFPVSWS